MSTIKEDERGDPAAGAPARRSLRGGSRYAWAEPGAAPGVLSRRDRAVAAFSGAAVVVALVLTRGHGLHNTVPTVLVLALALWALICRRRARYVLAWPVAAVSVLSLAADFARPHPIPEAAGAWKITEVFVLMALIGAVVCWSPRRDALVGAVLGGAAVSLWTIPFVDDGTWQDRAFAVVFWAAAAAIAAGVGAYPRRLAGRGRRAVAAARREQQLELARDLHDFVAHDVSAIVVQAQAARFVAETDPRAVVQALERIEKAGLSALASMDRTVQMLHAADGAPLGASAPPGLGELPDLVGRFAAERTGGADLAIEPDAEAGLPREAGAVAYRVVVEALTNIRRHAAAWSRVEVSVRRDASGIRVAVANDASSAGAPWTRGRRGGRGLVGLRERVAAVGGTLDAGPDGGGGWCVVARFPEEA
ncbi:sensor histidine kinase [Yinghuangia sp. YIM S09857]|uniref:sensor histidine kinase n=1 Tax=Yinghuangia sp. YIM S09857 TaxID=3436929 RepID=UPI003F5320DA